MTPRRNISSGSKWEPLLGYSRAVVAGNTVYVSGTVGANADGTIPEGAYAQTKRALEINLSLDGQQIASAVNYAQERAARRN